MNTRVLVADDEVNIADPIKYALEREGFNVSVAYDGKEAIDIIKKIEPTIVVLDIMMPKQNGYDVCRELTNKNIGIIMLTAKNSTIDKVLGLELGADDYITKPFELQELIARVRSLNRRIKKSDIANKNSRDIFVFEDLRIDNIEHVVSIDNNTIDFKPKEFELLLFLAQNKQTTFTRDQILDSVWDIGYYGGTRTVDIHIQRIRKKLKNYSKLIKTVPKIGYKFVEHYNEN